MAERTNPSRARQLGALSGRVLRAAGAVLAVAVGGGLMIGLSPILIAALAAAAMLVAAIGPSLRAARQSVERVPSPGAVFAHDRARRGGSTSRHLSRDEIDELIAGLRATPGLTEDEREDDEREDDEREDDDGEDGD